MTRLLLVACLGLAGCGTAPLVGAAAGGGIVATIITARQDANLGLSIIKPLNASVVCPIAESQPHDARTAAAIKAFCANLPTTVEGIPIQALAVMQAIEAVPESAP
ncbi:MAG: hypothetical protein JWO51_127 [Rhodospirillales bacterium]|nr:hypothetical protein [Rhodospirillales bacterium]